MAPLTGISPGRAERKPPLAGKNLKGFMIRKVFASVLLVLVIVGVLAGTKVIQIRTLLAAAKSMGPPPESVSTVTVQEQQWQNTLSAIGSIAAVQGVNVTTEVPGTVVDIKFDPGAVVEKGALLLRLDTSAEEAQLRAAEAQVELAKVNAERERTLRSQQMVSQSELDTAEATLKQNQANADAIRAVIEKKTIRAPFAGRLGIRQVNLGQYLDVGKPIVSLQSLTPVYANFSLPQQELAKLSTGMRVRLTTDTYPGRQFEGKLTAYNPDLDQSTRSITLQATMENADQALRPGMFAQIEVLLPQEDKVLVVPITSVLSAPFGDSVFIVESKETTPGAKPALVVRQQFVRTGRTRGDFITIESGLKPGERIVSAGAFKLHNGSSVVENNSIVPPAEQNPHPADS